MGCEDQEFVYVEGLNGELGQFQPAGLAYERLKDTDFGFVSGIVQRYLGRREVS